MENRNGHKGSFLIGKIIVTMIIIFPFAILFALGIIPIPFGIGFAKAPVSITTGDYPCLSEENIKPVKYKNIKVSVLNSTDKAGLASKVADQLKKRNINVAFVGNTSTKFETSVQIFTNKKDIDKAYSVALNFSDYKIIYKENIENIEVILGEQFTNILPDTQFLQLLKKPLKNVEKCIKS